MEPKENLVYCIVCQQLVAKENCERVFKTGFYMREFPLAECRSCHAGLPQAGKPV